ncbi:hypothetical protein ACJMK2_017515 [Sinanodonta woodiana]|uniref:Sulfotransferase domain-containing protein n=1 Tax=Sinanodonta woodiana TaxID=1069815 RepID=A0ABD3UC68_SINWO
MYFRSFRISRRFFSRIMTTILVALFILRICHWISSVHLFSRILSSMKGGRYIDYNMQNLMAKPKFDFLPNFKNPCFITKEAKLGEKTNANYGKRKLLPHDSIRTKKYDIGFGQSQDIQLSRDIRIGDHQVWSGRETQQSTYADSGGRLYCLPYFIIAGFPKCGTTDLWQRMIQHPDIVVHPEKEPMFFDNRRFYNGTPTINPPVTRTEKYGTWTLETYLEYFTQATKYIDDHIEERNGGPYHAKITGEGSVNTMPINDEWFQLPENANLREPKFTNADHVHHVVPHIKIIVMIRDPVERLLSGHLYFSEQFKYNTSAELFHNVTVDAVNKFKDCLKYNTERGCAYNKSITTIKNRIRVGLYSIHIADWFRVFPRDQFLFLKAEDYIKDVRTTLVTVFDFLQLEFPPLQAPSRFMFKEKINQRKKTFSMLPATRKLLQDFYRPYNERLWRLIDDRRFHYTYP